MKLTNEQIIAALKRRQNRGERIQIENPIPVSYDQAKKGFAWLWDKYRTPRGAERKNNPFSNPEEKALEWANMHGAWFTFNGFYANAKVEVFKEPTGGFCYKFQPDLGSWTCIDSHRITFMRHNKIEKRFERLRVKDVDDKYTRYINRDRTKSGEYLPLKLNRINMIRSESWEHSEIEEAAVEAFLKDNGDSYIMEEMILAADFLMP